jgi:predicted amidohydrolase
MMPKLINVGLYAKNGWKEANDGIVHRISDLDTAIDTAFTTLAPSVPVPAGGPVTSTLSAYSEADKDTLRAEFGRLSQKKTNFLLVPGSVFWKLDIAKKHVWSKKKQAEIRNTTFAYHDGNELFAYDKMNDCGELSAKIPEESKKCRFVAGLAFGVFDCDGLRVGLETCLDHDKGMLKKNDEKLDLHIISSKTVSYTPAHRSVKSGGYVLHANALQQAFGCNIYGHPHGIDNNLKLAKQGMVTFGRVVI